MCTLSYLLTDNGYELFFNRDEQRSRPIALPPKHYKNVIYPLDPQGSGTWLAVNKYGLSLALLNYYQACESATNEYGSETKYVSRGQLIPYLMTTITDIKHNDSVGALLQKLDLAIYQPFQLAIFPANLTKLTKLTASVDFYQWDGKQLRLTQQQQPFTSSGVNFAYVEKQRKNKFKQLICPNNATREQFKSFHLSQENEGSYSVNMERFDAKTVSISHICVAQNKTDVVHQEQHKLIQFDYFDNIKQQQYTCCF